VQTSLSPEGISALVEGNHQNPFELLGPHQVREDGQDLTFVRAYLPNVAEAWLLHNDDLNSQPMRLIHPAGLYEAVYPSGSETGAGNYQIRIADEQGQTTVMDDPYSFPPLLTDYDIHLMAEGNHWDAYERLGAHLRTIDGVSGVNFALWAPNATSISVIGDFNNWDARSHQMRKHGPSGFWELFVPGLEAGANYKFRVRHPEGEVEKCDPYGFYAEVPPRTASIVADLNSYEWNDAEWIERRKAANPLEQPVSIYEVHLGSWKQCDKHENGWANYRDLAHQLSEYCLEMGYTHIELMPISEHPYTGSWGYQTVGYFATTSRYGSPEDFMYFVDHMHQCGLGVIIDWVPAHFPKDDHGLRRFDGTALYEHEDPRLGEHPDWGTLIFNYGRNEVRNFLLSNALFWLDKYHIDGLRVDAVASMLYLDYSREADEWVPNKHGGRENLEAIDLLRIFNEQVHLQHPGVMTIAEESTAWGGVSRPTYTGGLGFTLKWNMGWMNDTLRYMRKDPIHRTHHHDELTFSLIYAFTENFCLPFSHDEVVHGKGALLDQMPGDLWQKFANLRMLYSYMWTHPGKKLLYMGNDFGQWKEWDHESSLQWDLLEWDTHQGIKRMMADLNKLYQNEPALYEVDFEEGGFEWLDCHSRDDSVLVYMRKAKDPDDQLIVCCNFTPTTREKHRVPLTEPGFYDEVFNSDSEFYGGSNQGNGQGCRAEETPWHGQRYSLEATLPPLGIVVFKPRRS
jgi:1,4-alpha-glucan branching enzyme